MVNVETILNTETQKARVYIEAENVIILEIIEIDDSSFNRLYLAKAEALALANILSDYSQKVK